MFLLFFLPDDIAMGTHMYAQRAATASYVQSSNQTEFENSFPNIVYNLLQKALQTASLGAVIRPARCGVDALRVHGRLHPPEFVPTHSHHFHVMARPCEHQAQKIQFFLMYFIFPAYMFDYLSNLAS